MAKKQTKSNSPATTAERATKALPPDQGARRQIVEELDTTMMVEAAAGTGKTTSMIARMVALLREDKCKIENLAAVTFTRKSAAEMRARFQVELERSAREATGPAKQRLADAVARVERCFMGTIHSFCARLLRERPIEAGVDLAFVELEPEVDARLMDQAWDDYVAELFACNSPLLGELRDLGLQVELLRPAFAAYATYPDVEDWPAPGVDMGDLRPVVQQLGEYVRHMESLIPTFPDERGNDKLMGKYEALVRQVRQLNLDRSADLLLVLENFGSAGAVQKAWPAGSAQGKHEKNRWEDFADRVAKPLVERWRELRYATVMRVLAGANARYDQLRKRSGGLNYQDLLICAADLLRDKPAIRQYFRRRYTHLFVDEFQDTDPVQAQVMMYLSADDPHEADWRSCRPVPGSLFVVGDPKQSIYRFRRADIVTYNQVKAIIEAVGGAVVALTANFRTLGELVDWGNGIFDREFPSRADAYSPARRPMLIGRSGGSSGHLAGINTLTIPQEHGNASSVVDFEADRIARFIRHAIDAKSTVPRTEEELKRGTPLEARPGDFLIVARNKWNLARYAQKLQELGVPHQVTGGSALGQVPELALLVKCLAALLEPDNPVALLAVLRGDLFGFSDEVLFAYREAQGKFSFRATVPDKTPEKAARLFANAFERLQRYAYWLNRLPPLAAIERIAADLGLIAQAATAKGGNIQAGIIAKAFEMLRAAQGELHSASELTQYLQELIEQDVEFDGLPALPHAESTVRIMNLHKVKGLEAPIVILADATGKKSHEARLHIDRSGSKTKGYLAVYGPKRGWQSPPPLARPAGWDGFAAEEDRFRQAEEKRLLYVAATRAGTQLTIVKREAGGDKNHWQFFVPYTAGIEELADPGPQQQPTDVTVHVNEETIEEAMAAVSGRWQASQQPSYAAAAAKEISVTPSGLHHVAASGEHGTEWGTVIHFLLEAAMRTPAADFDALAQMALSEQGLDVAMAPAAVRVVEKVTSSEIWRRAMGSKRSLVEVPFVTKIDADKSVTGLPTVLRGVIDLAFEEQDGWVIVDYKTDSVTEDRLPLLVQHYRGQVERYASTWQEMLGEQVKESGLYFTSSGQYIRV
ncbi:MAG: UvrD-helicase domain-containing protein [Pirellulales bacterium]